MNYPDTITVPIAEDFCRQSYTNGRRHCLLGWMHKHFDPSGGEWMSADGVLKKACRIRPEQLVSSFNDNSMTTTQDLADAYERFLVLMGYEVTP